jgi:UDP-N-acetylglucosamine acyltransferase
MPNRIHPTAIIGAGVELGEDNVVGPYSVLVGPLVVGDRNWIGPHVTLGTPAEDRGGPHPVGWADELAGEGVRIGSDNKIREYVSVQQGTHRPTVVGDNCYLLSSSHAGHDVVIGDDVVLACSVQLGGHAEIWDFANLGLGTVVHQHCVIGPGAMVGMGSAIRHTVPPFSIAVGNPARVSGVNEVGLRRRGCDEDTIAALSPYVKGKGDLPAQLPAELAILLKRWAERPAEQH